MIEITILDDDGNEVTMDLPSHKVVCDDCEGEGTVLCSGMRYHCYSEEEFYASFDEEEREEYFRRGGRYDVTCPTCKGKNVVDAVNIDACTPEQKEHYEAHQEQEREYAAWDLEGIAERRLGA
jgi:hypothetical protein